MIHLNSNNTYTGESPQVPNEKPAASSLVPELEVVSSNIQHVIY